MRVAFSDRASDYLKTEYAYVARANPRAAKAIVRQIRAAVRTIGDYPEVGIALAAAAGARRFVTPPYHVDYIVRGDRVIIVAIRHGRQAPLDPGIDDDDFEG